MGAVNRKAKVAMAAVGAFAVGVLLGPWVFDSPMSSTVEIAGQTATVEVGSVDAEGALADSDQSAADALPEQSPPPTLQVSSEPTLTQDDQENLLAGVLPESEVAASTGELSIVPGASPAPEGNAPVMTVRVEIEDGLVFDEGRLATFVVNTLNDPRGWSAQDLARFEWTDGEADLRVVLATPDTVDEMCAPLETDGLWSCAWIDQAVLNAQRWLTGADAFVNAGGSLTSYRQYLVNHEVGHLLGQQHASCSGAGELAPVMVQQSISVDQCLPNGWPEP